MQDIDPRVRVAAALLLCVGIAAVQSLMAALVGLFGALLWLALAMAGPRPPLRALLHRLLAVNVFVALLWCTTPWATPGTAFCSLGPLTISHEGLHLALLVTIKANALACVFMALIASLPLPALTQALRFFRCPDKLVLLCVMAMRNIHVLANEWQRLRTAARLRGFAPTTNVHSYKTLANLLGLLLLRSLDRATRLREALLLRGFQGNFPTAPTRPLRLADIAFLLVVVAQGLCLCALEAGILA